MPTPDAPGLGTGEFNFGPLTGSTMGQAVLVEAQSRE